MRRRLDGSAQVVDPAAVPKTLHSTNPATGDHVWSGKTGDAVAEVEEIWAAIASDDDWARLEAKVAAVRRMGEAMVADAPAAA
jgi:acyl-CoA reductase-like NAD-dependent aldehyde dehydrogenase